VGRTHEILRTEMNAHNGALLGVWKIPKGNL
jgi:hypothetical protein